MPEVKKIWIYMLGLLPLALFYAQLKGLASGPVFLVSAVVYLLLIRFIAEKLGREVAKAASQVGSCSSIHLTASPAETIPIPRWLPMPSKSLSPDTMTSAPQATAAAMT